MGTKKVKLNWKITAKKMLKNAVYVFIAGLATVYGDNAYYLLLAPLLNGVVNSLKHGTSLLDCIKDYI